MCDAILPTGVSALTAHHVSCELDGLVVMKSRDGVLYAVLAILVLLILNDRGSSVTSLLGGGSATQKSAFVSSGIAASSRWEGHATASPTAGGGGSGATASDEPWPVFGAATATGSTATATCRLRPHSDRVVDAVITQSGQSVTVTWTYDGNPLVTGYQVGTQMESAARPRRDQPIAWQTYPAKGCGTPMTARLTGLESGAHHLFLLIDSIDPDDSRQTAYQAVDKFIQVP